MKIRILVFWFIILCSCSSYSQDPLFVNSQQSLVYLNPSFAGSNGLFRTQALYRAPARNKEYSSTTFYNGADVYIKPLKGGIAFTYQDEDYGRGKLKIKTGALTYAQYFSFLNNQLRIVPSLQIGFMQRELDKSKISFSELSDNRFGYHWNIDAYGSMAGKRNLDVGSGLLINHKNFYFGASVFHINQPNVGLYGDTNLPARIAMHSSYTSRVNLWTVVNFFAQYQLQDKFNFWQTKINFLVANHFIFGIGGHSRDAASLNLGYKTKYFTLGLGYDQSLINFSDRLNAAWEAQFSLNIRKKENDKSATAFERW
jgi:type IX secretion system PorP/SprF family membrane protein